MQAEVEEAVKREIESATGSRLAQARSSKKILLGIGLCVFSLQCGYFPHNHMVTLPEKCMRFLAGKTQRDVGHDIISYHTLS